MLLLWDKIHNYYTGQDIMKPIICPDESHTATMMLVLSLTSVVPKLVLFIIIILTRWIRVKWMSHHEKVWPSGG